MKKLTKKLVLARQTIRELRHTELVTPNGALRRNETGEPLSYWCTEEICPQIVR
jgi:hypothetical protein